MPLVVYNKGKRLFTHYEVELVAGRNTPIPEKHELGIRKLLADYPDELIESGAGGAASSAPSPETEKELARLRDQVEKMQRLISNSDGAEREAELKRQLGDLEDRLEAALKSTDDITQRSESVIADLQAQLAEARAPKPDAAPVAETPPPAPVAAHGRRRQ